MAGMNRVLMVDRDGVLSDLVYNQEEGHIGSPIRADQLRVFPYTAPTLKRIKDELGFKVIVISNQPGVAKRQFTYAELERMNGKIRKELDRVNCAFDGEYYCLHHPDALIAKYKVNCDCRKPKPGLILKAAKEHDIDLKKSFFIGDALIDVKAGKAAGCKTILVGHYTDFLNRMMKEEDAFPDHMIPSLKEAPKLLRSLEKV
jgi:D-glycero-D-manno-heptose 1,7-bisphosphate phosphatase